MAGKTEIKPDQLRSVASDIEAMGGAFDKLVQYINSTMLKNELGRVSGYSEQASKSHTGAVAALSASAGKGAAFIKGVAATLKASADQHSGTESANKQNLSNADGGA